MNDELVLVRELARRAEQLSRGGDLAARANDVVGRLEEPLRVAICGRAKAGKSTLLNALVGERLAATDASECTRIVTWYRHGLGYGVRAKLRGNGSVDLPFRREAGTLQVALNGLSATAVDHLDVEWPSARLSDLTLLDTPGLASVDAESANRTLAALLGRADEQAHDGSGASDRSAGVADAVVYLMRHLHRRDAEFLEAFAVGSLAQGSPVDSLAVLSRADELGAGSLDALESAGRIAQRYAADDRLSRLVSAVVPVCGLLAETALTLREEEFAALREVVRLPDVDLRDALLSVDHFRFSEKAGLPPSVREGIVERFGLFGLRLSVVRIRGGEVQTSAGLSRMLVEASGLNELQRLLQERFAARSRALKARSALAALRRLAADLTARGVDGGRALASDVERAEATSTELSVLRLLHLALTRTARLSEEERAEVERLAATSADTAARLGATVDTPPDRLRGLALAATDRWRIRASSPLADRRTVEAAEIAARTYEALYASL